MFKKLLILSFLVCFVLGIGFLLAGPPKLKPQPQPRPVYDISISDMWLDNGCCLCAKFENKGNTSITKDVKGEVWVDGKFFLYTVLTNFSLPPGQTYTWQGDSPFRLTGSHTVKMIIDSNNQIAESDETNNTMTKSFTCQLQFIPPIETRKPDLTVVIWKDKVKDGVDAYGKPCSWVNVHVYIHNESTTKAGAFKVKMEVCELKYGGNLPPPCYTKWLDVNSLPGGQKIDYFLGQFNNCEAGRQGYIFEATVDVNNTVGESNEKNNRYIEHHPTQPLHK